MTADDSFGVPDGRQVRSSVPSQNQLQIIVELSESGGIELPNARFGEQRLQLQNLR